MSDGLDARVAALAAAVDHATGRIDEDVVAAAGAVVDRAGTRIGLGLETTVVALAGPTGAGKSSLFNLLAGAEVAKVGRLRPTTAAATAAVWGDVGDALLDWLDVPRRHRVDGAREVALVLLDLPDFDSVELAHRVEVDRVVELADLVLWVVDPQKYADAVWHDQYLRKLVAYEASMAVVLNQSDLLTPDALAACAADLRRLLERERLSRVPIVVVSAETGRGVDELRRLLDERVAARAAAAARLAADVDVAAAAFAPFVGDDPRGMRRGDRERLVTALAEAAGVPVVVRAVGAAHRRRGALATGWPVLRWVRRVRPDPLRRFRLGDVPQEETRTSLPPPSPVHLARVDGALRALAAGASEGLPSPWPTRLRDVALATDARLGDRLDRAVAGADLHVRRPRWWSVASLLQKLLLLAVLAGTLWLLALVGLGFLRLDDVVPVPEVEEIPVPTALLIGGAVAGILIAFFTRIVNGFGARRRARAAERELNRRIAVVADEVAVVPVEAELAAYDALRQTLRTASRDRGGRFGRRKREREGATIRAATRGGAVR